MRSEENYDVAGIDEGRIRASETGRHSGGGQ